MILAIDPGPTNCGIVTLEDYLPTFHHQAMANDDVLDVILEHGIDVSTVVVIEKIEAMGMTVGAEVFETVFWSGRFAQRAIEAGLQVERVTRRAVKLNLCGTMRAKDPNVRQALIDRYGGDSVAKGRKAAPGPLFGFAGDAWAALAVGVTYLDKHNGRS